MPKPPVFDEEPPSQLSPEQWAAVEGKLARLFDPELAVLLVAQLRSTTGKWGWCPRHGRTVQIQHYDSKAVMEAIKFIVAYDKGKPVERREIEVSGRVTHELEQLSDAELEVLAAEEGEWRALPPA